MKTLYLLRHGKSSRDDPGLADFERPLNARGRRAAKLMGEHMARSQSIPDIVLCSSSVRTRQTLERVLRSWPKPKPAVHFDRNLYLAPAKSLMRLIGRIDAQARSAMLVGHAPGIRDLALLLADKRGDIHRDRLARKFPTAALAVLTFPVRRWDQIAAGRGELISFLRPKDLDTPSDKETNE